uniref:Uncharacterized protein n=1 Tax=Strix occidentalis caurina TaxID=311401 RepID=A0A8D0FJN2_STROC
MGYTLKKGKGEGRERMRKKKENRNNNVTFTPLCSLDFDDPFLNPFRQFLSHFILLTFTSGCGNEFHRLLQRLPLPEHGLGQRALSDPGLPAHLWWSDPHCVVSWRDLTRTCCLLSCISIKLSLCKRLLKVSN